MTSTNSACRYAKNDAYVALTLGNLTSLQFLWLSDNRLSGCVPRSLTNMPELSIWTGVFGIPDC